MVRPVPIVLVTLAMSAAAPTGPSAAAVAPAHGREAATGPASPPPEPPATVRGLPADSVGIPADGMAPAEAGRRLAELQATLLHELGPLPRVGRVAVVIVGPSVVRDHPVLLTLLAEWHPDLGFYVVLDVSGLDDAQASPAALEGLRVRNNIRSYQDRTRLIRHLGGWSVHEAVYVGTASEASACRAVAGRLALRQAPYEGLAPFFQQLLASVRQRRVTQLSAADLRRAQALAAAAEHL